MPEYISGPDTSGREDVIPEDDYRFTVDDAVEKESRNTGNPMIELELLISHNGKQIRVYDHLVFTRKAFWKIDQFRVAIGEKLVEGQKVNFEAENCIGREGRCHLIIDTFEGKTRNKVDSYLPPAVSLNESGEPDDLPF
jgi:hypothetical protein